MRQLLASISEILVLLSEINVYVIVSHLFVNMSRLYYENNRRPLIVEHCHTYFILLNTITNKHVPSIQKCCMKK